MDKNENNKAQNNNINITDHSNNSNNNALNNKNKVNSSYDRSLQQSPKIGTGRLRPLSSKPRPFSLLDFDDKKNLTKGTNLPSQMKRYPEKELNKLIGDTSKRAGNNDCKKKLIQNFLNKEDKDNKNLKMKRNNTIDAESKLHIDKKDMKKNLTINIGESININNKKEKSHTEKNLKKIKKEIEEKKNPEPTFHRPLSAQLRTKKDRWLPKGYPEYEYCILHQKFFNENLKKNPFIKNELIYNIKEIKDKSNKSDIFFLGPKTEKEAEILVNSNKQKAGNYNTKLGSDAFMQKRDIANLMKTSETYLFKNINYPKTNELTSYWSARANVPSYINSPSVEYNILNPKAKGITKTKERMQNECEKKKNDEGRNYVNYINPIFRQKSISEFYNITKGGMNKNMAFEKLYRENPRSFCRNNNICTLHSDLYNKYKGISERPFMNQTNKKIQV
jgi:hypothetical protein